MVPLWVPGCRMCDYETLRQANHHMISYVVGGIFVWVTYPLVRKNLDDPLCKACMKGKVDQSCPALQPHGLYSPWNSPGQNTGVGSLFHLQGILPTQELYLGLPHFRQILYQLSHKGSPRILEWVAYPFSSDGYSVTVAAPWTTAHQAPLFMGFSR